MSDQDQDPNQDQNQNQNQEWTVEPGTEVVDVKDRPVGRIDDIRDGHLVVRKGRFFSTDYYIPFGAIASHDDTTIYLGVEADDVAAEIWRRPPGWQDRGGNVAGPSAMDAEERLEHLTDQEGNVHVPIIREELVPTRRPVVRGAVRIETRLTEHEETREIPVTEERVRIQRRRFGHDAGGGDIVLEDGTFEIPFYGEDVDVQTRVRVIEEIVITREAVETVRRVRGTVRHEEAIVDDSSVPAANADKDPGDVARPASAVEPPPEQ